ENFAPERFVRRDAGPCPPDEHRDGVARQPRASPARCSLRRVRCPRADPDRGPRALRRHRARSAQRGGVPDVGGKARLPRGRCDARTRHLWQDCARRRAAPFPRAERRRKPGKAL
ncbi:MAG: hypothetical protein AVDCRST_MAG90-337, partial [uncultured Microvirga sp.]